MLTKAQIKHLQGLKLKKYRQNYGDFVIEGEKLVTEALLENVFPDLIIATPEWLAQHAGGIPEQVGIAEAGMRDIEKISSLSTPQPVMALVKKKETHIRQIVPHGHWILALDGIQDPGNLGTMLRTADWFGVQAVVCSNDSVDLYNPKVVQSTMGAIFRMPVAYTDLDTWFPSLQVPRYAAVLQGEPLENSSFGREGVLVIGSESHGISSAVLAACDHTVTIAGFGRTESLNAGIAAGILLHSIMHRQ